MSSFIEDFFSFFVEANITNLGWTPEGDCLTAAVKYDAVILFILATTAGQILALELKKMGKRGRYYLFFVASAVGIITIFTFGYFENHYNIEHRLLVGHFADDETTDGMIILPESDGQKLKGNSVNIVTSMIKSSPALTDASIQGCTKLQAAHEYKTLALVGGFGMLIPIAFSLLFGLLASIRKVQNE